MIEVCQLSEGISEHIWPAWRCSSNDSPIEQINCEVTTGAESNRIGYISYNRTSLELCQLTGSEKNYRISQEHFHVSQLQKTSINN